MPFLRLNPREILIPRAEVLPDSRKRLTRTLQIASPAVQPVEFGMAWGDLDPFPQADVPSGWTGLRLIKIEARDEARPFTVAKGEDSRPVVEMVFEQIDATGETQVGAVDTTKLEDGRTAKVFEYVQFTTGTYTPGTVGTSTAPGDSSAFLLKEEAPDDGTLRRIKRTYVYAGLLEQNDEIKQGGALLIRTLKYAKTVPPTPSGYTLIGSPVQSPNGLPVYTYTFAKGSGLVRQVITIREDGLREQTYVALGTKQTPTGVVILDEVEEADGYEIFTVRCMQSADGGDPTGGTLTLQRNVPFTYPGRAKAYSASIGSGTLIDVYLDPPVEASIPGTITITYQTSSSLSGIGTRWMPVGWAGMTAKFITFGGTASSKIQGLRGYRAMNSGSAVSVTTPSVSYGPTFYNTCTCVGEPVYGNTTATIVVYGGPPDPTGNTYVLEASTELAFVDVSGTKYYRQTVITATIPAQPALPV